MIEFTDKIAITTTDGHREFYVFENAVPVVELRRILSNSKSFYLKKYDRVVIVNNIVHVDFFNRENNESN